MSSPRDELSPAAGDDEASAMGAEVEATHESESTKVPPPKGTKRVCGLKTKLAKLADAREKKLHLLQKLNEKALMKALGKRDADTKSKYEKWLAHTLKTIAEVKAELEEAEAEAAEAAALLARKDAAKKEAADAARDMSDQGAITLVELVLDKYARAFENNSDSVAKVWPHVHADFMAKVDAGELPATDGRSVESLRTRWVAARRTHAHIPPFTLVHPLTPFPDPRGRYERKDRAEYRLWMGIAERAASTESGVPVEELELRVTKHFR
jgi:hypothetical protein